jgi:hypothetical protein
MVSAEKPKLWVRLDKNEGIVKAHVFGLVPEGALNEPVWLTTKTLVHSL